MSAVRSFLLYLALALPFGCQPPPPIADPGPLRMPFAVSNFFTPSGHMGDGEVPGALRADVLTSGCKPRPPDAVGDCYRFVYHPGDKRWAGVYWVYPANNWGSRAGRAIEGRRFTQVRLQAASATPGLLTNFLVGRIRDPLLPHRDQVSATALVELGPTFQTVRLDIAAQDFDHVIGALAWSVAYPTDWDGQRPVEIFLDDIVWTDEPQDQP